MEATATLQDLQVVRADLQALKSPTTADHCRQTSVHRAREAEGEEEASLEERRGSECGNSEHTQ